MAANWLSICSSKHSENMQKFSACRSTSFQLLCTKIWWKIYMLNGWGWVVFIAWRLAPQAAAFWQLGWLPQAAAPWQLSSATRRWLLAAPKQPLLGSWHHPKLVAFGPPQGGALWHLLWLPCDSCNPLSSCPLAICLLTNQRLPISPPIQDWHMELWLFDFWLFQAAP